MSDNKVNLWRSSIMLFSFWSSSTQSLCSFNNQIVPVQISQLLLSRIFTKLVNIQQPSVTWREICSWTWLCDIFPLLKRNHLVNSNLLKIHHLVKNHLVTKSLKDRPGTQSLQWRVSPPWSWSSWRGHSLPTHRHTCRLKMKYFQMYDKEWHGTAFTILVMFFLSQKCKRKMTQRRKEREGLTCVFCMFRMQAFHSVLVHIMV